MDGLFLGVMDIHEAKTHQTRLRQQGIAVEFRTNGHTCTTGCKVTVEVWGRNEDEEKLLAYFQSDYLKHVKGHLPDFAALASVFDPSAESALCQACGARFSSSATECPECGLYYGP